MLQFTHMLLTAAAGYQKPLPGQMVYASSRHGYITAIYTSYSFVVPPRVTNITALCVGPGATFYPGEGSGTSGRGGALVYGNNIAVTPGETLTIEFVDGNNNTGEGNYSRLKRGSTILLYAYQLSDRGGTEADGGGNGGESGSYNAYYYQSGASGQMNMTSGAGGAGGYTGSGGSGGWWYGPAAGSGAGGGGGGGGGKQFYGIFGDVVNSGNGGGGGVGLLGQGANGAGGGNTRTGGGGGSGGEGGGTGGVYGVYNTPGDPNSGLQYYVPTSGSGGNYGGGKGAGDYGGGFEVESAEGFWGAGAIRIIWPGDTRSYPNTNTGNL